MKISYAWLKEYISLKESPETLAELLTSSGLEVVRVGPPSHLDSPLLQVGTVRAEPKEEEGQKVVEVSIKEGQRVAVPCAAFEVKIGDRVVVALARERLRTFNGEYIEVGLEEKAMLCSEYLLGFSADASKPVFVRESEADCPDGSSAVKGLADEKDHIFEIDLTPNRGDAASHYGVARELSVLLGRRLQMPTYEDLPSASSQETKAQIQIEDQVACPRYGGVWLNDLRVGPSPSWLQRRLRSIGLVPHNNVVDITNYICHGLGQPLHAFDAVQLTKASSKASTKGPMHIRLADKAQSMTLLDGKRYALQAEDVLICNGTQTARSACRDYGRTSKCYFYEN